VSEAAEGSPGRSAPKPADVVWLFFRPRRFFADVDLDHRWWYMSALALGGITATSGRVDEGIIRAELGQSRPGWEEVSPLFLDSWVTLWLFLFVGAAVYAPFFWYLGGWWYKVRLRWSGAEAPDPRDARLVMVSAALVAALPSVLLLIGQTLMFSNYGEAWASEELLSVVLIVFPFWSVYASYRGVRTRFEVSKWRGRTWFLFLPALVYMFLLGLVALLYALLFEPVGPGGGYLAIA